MSHQSHAFIAGIAALLLCGLGAAATAAPEPAEYWTGDVDAPVPKTLAGATVVHVRQVAALLRAAQRPVVIDVSSAPRPPAQLAPGAAWLPLPHPGLPGAVWLPGAGAGVLSSELDDLYRDRLNAETGGDRNRDVVVYCHEKCWLSWNAAKRAVRYGYRHVRWFAGGIEAWTAAGMPTQPVQPTAPAPSVAAALPPPDAQTAPKLVVLDLELTGDLGGPEFAVEHASRLERESARLRADLAATGRYRLIDPADAQDILTRLRSQQAYLHDCNGCDLEVGRQLRADLVMVAWVDRVSGLILSLTYEIHDVKTSQITARKSFDFRGDNDNAWNHAIDYMVRDLKNTLAVSANR